MESIVWIKIITSEVSELFRLRRIEITSRIEGGCSSVYAFVGRGEIVRIEREEFCERK